MGVKVVLLVRVTWRNGDPFNYDIPTFIYNRRLLEGRTENKIFSNSRIPLNTKSLSLSLLALFLPFIGLSLSKGSNPFSYLKTSRKQFTFKMRVDHGFPLSSSSLLFLRHYVNFPNLGFGVLKVRVVLGPWLEVCFRHVEGRKIRTCYLYRRHWCPGVKDPWEVLSLCFIGWF